ncbi:hypothetical protein CMK11_20120 [Candidatus Poribacteria bacterium]|nr:hypothetical protein [Candidatus Poribacteria bacterium]
MRIAIHVGDISLEAVLNESTTASALWEALPIEADGSVWGDEIYFPVPLDAEPEDAKEVVDMGEIAYWSPGSAFCIFYGRTPASRGDEIRPASAVNPLGHIQGDATTLRGSRNGVRVTLERLE